MIEKSIKISEVVEVDKKYCLCGCGREAPKASRSWHKRGIKKGQYLDYISGHHMRGKNISVTSKLKSAKSHRAPSPYLPNKMIRYNERDKRWFCSNPLKQNSTIPHARAVYEYNFGVVSSEFVVHHKNGKHESVEDDRIENLMLLPKIWNMQYLPYLAKGFNVEEAIVTECYIKAIKTCSDKNLFIEICKLLIKNKEDLF